MSYQFHFCKTFSNSHLVLSSFFLPFLSSPSFIQGLGFSLLERKNQPKKVRSASTTKHSTSMKIRRWSVTGLGLYTNMKTGEQTFYSGLRSNITQSGQTSTASSSVKLKSSNRKRQTGGDPINTQESVAN
ncbi:uncharacterized protein [Gossypium hirsutum]|uniref:Uncharacterized protein isoform X4 n=1 Tax=Gossypium hirsutum TaxID=3635 RepID=A0ABM3C2A7_GOSHI|nr:uncharacterized protein LOC107926611 isoform X4 [Gossypium hirsutum]